MKAAAELSWQATRLRLERAAGYWLVCVGGGAAIAGLLHGWLPLVLGNLAGLAVSYFSDRFRRITPRDVALHLDRALPELEESATLLLEPAPASGLASLQRERIAARWDVARVAAAIPHHELHRSLLFAFALGVAGVALRWLVPPAPTRNTAAPVAAAGGRLDIRAVALRITPPRYTGLPARGEAGADVEVPEGSALGWEVELTGPVTAAWLASTAGDSVPLVHGAGARWTAAGTATRSALWRAEAAGPDTLRARSTDLRLAVRPDRPPTLTVVAPPERTELAPDSLRPVAVEVRASDDYGVDSASLAVTIASGRGEAVRFRRLSLPFARRTTLADGELGLEAALDPAQLGLGPGDELYFTAIVTDRRAPVPNRSRSDTRFLAVRDTAAPPTGDLARMALGVEPEYFRSQRQVIIDTEKLLADSAGLTRTTFRDRANGIGIDQGLLRLRYGQFLGEEFEESEGGVGEVHLHDDAENATLLGQSVKSKLRAAVAAMWQAELKLRTGEPRAALPHEYRALDFIKQVQQEARSYVQRVGFEPPPIEVAKLRLTGKLEGLAGQQRQETVAPAESLPAIRAALAALAAPGPLDRVALQAAGVELAGLAVADPARLPAVQELRRTLDADAAGNPCPACLQRLARELYAALPPAPPPPRTAPERASGSPLAARARALLRDAPR